MRFYLHVRQADGLLIEDFDGVECSTVEHAKEEAMRCLRELAAEALKDGDPPPATGIVIHDQLGLTETIIDLFEALPKGWQVWIESRSPQRH